MGAGTMVTYTYGSESYSFKVFDDGGSYSFCGVDVDVGGASDVVGVTLQSGINVGCP